MRILRSRSFRASLSDSNYHFNVGFRRFVTSCRAVVLPRFGGPEVLELRPNVNVPDLKPHEVLVRTRAVSINPLDTRMRSGYGRSIFEPLLPLILGRDISGEVAAVGDSVRGLSIGQEVFGALHPTAVRGTYADYAILSDEELAPKPPSVTHVEASVIPFAALTAWRALKSTARIAEGQRVLVVGGGGAVGLAAIQISVAQGCYVTTTCGKQSIDRVLAAGAEQAVDYTEDIELVIKGKFDAVLDTIGGPETERISINFLKRGGHYMTLQGEAASLTDRYGIAFGLPVATAVLLKKQNLYRCSHGIEYWWTYMRADSEGLFEIRKLSEAGKLNIPVEKTFPITQVIEAHEAKEKKQIHGKANYRFRTNLQRRLYGRATDVVIRPMDEEKAVGAAAELLGELVIFTVAGLAIIYEVQRSARSEARKEEQRRQEIEAMKQKGTDLEKEVQCLKAKLQEMEQLVQRRSWLDLIRFWQSQALEEHKSARFE